VCDRTDLFGGRALISRSLVPKLFTCLALKEREYDMANQDPVPAYVKAINASWHKSTDSILETARICAEAEKKLSADEKTKLFKDLVFSKATFSKLAKVGSQARLLNEDVKPLLPPNYSILYAIAKLSEKDLRQAMKDGIINPNMSRADLESWTAEQLGQSKKEEQEEKRVIATLLAPADFERDKELQQAIDKLRADFGLVVQLPRDLELEAESRMLRKIDDYIRKGARLYIRKLKSAKLANHRHLTPAVRKRLWNYSDDEIEIRPDATWDDVHNVLDYVGSGDQFERLRDEALRLHGVSEKVVKKHAPTEQTLTDEEIEEMFVQLNKPSSAFQGSKIH
jgi:hypothetical protein